jgi:hypothetical protein
LLDELASWRAPVFDQVRAPGVSDALQHDPEKWVPVFGKDHAPTTK